MTLKILVFGQTGQVATELQALAGPDLVVEALGRDRADLADPAACAARVAETDAAVVINAAAYTAVDRAESEEALATVVNGHAPGAMARACATRGLPFLHISTDYVFDGSGDRPWREDDPTGPLGAYGRSKLEGERQVAAAGGPYVILRTAWVFSAHGSNFVKTMLKVGPTRDRLTVVDDQRGGPTPAGAIAEALVAIARAFVAERGVSGVFHFAGAPPVSWCGFAREIFARTGGPKVPEVAPIRTEDWPTPAVRPHNSVLDCSRIATEYGVGQPLWTEVLTSIVRATLCDPKDHLQLSEGAR
jgi:dTDP-4-dehydrorhamnose reductase